MKSSGIWDKKFADEKLEEEYVILFAAQRKFDEGPGENSPYAGNQIEKMIGSCTLEGKKEKRAPKASYAFMAFNLWQKINHLKVNRRGSERFLTEEERRRIADLAWKKRKTDLWQFAQSLVSRSGRPFCRTSV